MSKRQGQAIDQSLQKKVNTGSVPPKKDIPTSSGFSYGGLQKLKQQKQALQQSQKPALSTSSSSSQSFSYGHLKNKVGSKPSSSSNLQQQQQQQSSSENLKNNQKDDKQQPQQQQQRVKSQLEIAQETSKIIQQQKKEQQKILSSMGAKALPTSSSSASQIQKKQQQQILNKKLSKEDQQILHYQNELKKIDQNQDKSMTKDQMKLIRFKIKKKLAEAKYKQKVANGEIQEIVVTNPEFEDNENLKIDQKYKDLQMDDEGRLVDEDGKLINVEAHIGNAKINKSEKKLDKYKLLIKKAKMQRGSSAFVFDSNVGSVGNNKKRDKRKLHGLHFIDTTQATNGEQEEEIVDQTDLIEKIKDGSILERKKEDNQKQLENFQLQQKRIAVTTKQQDPIPDIEWWDVPFLKSKNVKSYIEQEPKKKQKNPEDGENKENSDSSSSSDSEDENDIAKKFVKNKIFDNPEEHFNNIEKIENTEFDEKLYNPSKINMYIEHPAQFSNNQKDEPEVIIPFYLTKQERKKIRRKKRLDKEKLKQDEIKLGLLDPPKPKAKLSNMVNIYGNEAYIDPSRVEQEVRQQVLERLQAHKKRNAEKKLNPEQRKEKFVKKLEKDSTVENKVILFRVENLNDGQHRYKIDANAIQMKLNGICLIGDYINNWSLVLIEGGPKSTKFFKNLMLRRIKWDQPSALHAQKQEEQEKKEQELLNGKKDQMELEQENNLDEDEINKNKKKKQRAIFDLEGNKCSLVWEGIVKDYHFDQWKVLELGSEVEGRKILGERGVEYYWDLVANYKEQE